MSFSLGEPAQARACSKHSCKHFDGPPNKPWRASRYFRLELGADELIGWKN